jgi:DNA-directed RNA polymerase beta subunit
VKYTIPECKERDATYAAPLKVKARLYNKDTDEMTEKEILGICAIKVINGEERGMFLEEQQKDNSYEAVDIRTMLMKFRDFSGYLPLVSHNISGSRLRIQ